MMHKLFRRLRLRLRLGALLACAYCTAGLMAPAAMAQPAPHVPKWASFQFQEENDVLAAVNPSDRAYTQGLLLSAVRHPDFTPRWAETLGTRAWGLLYPQRPVQTTFGVEFGQHIFTPNDITIPTLQVDDRPYVGWLYGGLLLYLTDDNTAVQRPVQQLIELQFGIVGPEALGDEAQTAVHRIIDSDLPAGWEHQLPFEPGLNLFYLWRTRIGPEHRHFDVVPHIGGALGTLQIYGNLGATVRLGFNISGFPLLQNTNNAIGTSDAQRSKWEAYLFASADGRLIGRNLFLDGSTFKDSHSIDRRDGIYDLKAGFSIRYKAFRLNYAYVRRSQELDRLPPGRDDGFHDYGSLSISVERSF